MESGLCEGGVKGCRQDGPHRVWYYVPRTREAGKARERAAFGTLLATTLVLCRSMYILLQDVVPRWMRREVCGRSENDRATDGPGDRCRRSVDTRSKGDGVKNQARDECANTHPP